MNAIARDRNHDISVTSAMAFRQYWAVYKSETKAVINSLVDNCATPIVACVEGKRRQRVKTDRASGPRRATKSSACPALSLAADDVVVYAKHAVAAKHLESLHWFVEGRGDHNDSGDGISALATWQVEKFSGLANDCAHLKRRAFACACLNPLFAFAFLSSTNNM